MYRLVVSLILTTLAAPLTAQAKVDFKKQIWPIFQKKCIECHSAPKTDASGRVKKPKGRVEMDTKGDGKVDYWEYYENGVMPRSGWDLNADGKIDKWGER